MLDEVERLRKNEKKDVEQTDEFHTWDQPAADTGGKGKGKGHHGGGGGGGQKATAKTEWPYWHTKSGWLNRMVRMVAFMASGDNDDAKQLADHYLENYGALRELVDQYADARMASR